ncbi:MAG: ArsR/SmtB family transcription factor [Pikeienuella sp.]
MDESSALAAFSALSQPTRLAVFRVLIQAGPVGMAAGEMSDKLDVRQNTLSANLSVLLNAGLLRNERQGRSIRYFVDMNGVRGLLIFLLQDCCGGQAKDCGPLIADLCCGC